MTRFIAALALAILCGCDPDWGTAVGYNQANPDPIEIVMDPDAPFIGQQYLPRSADNREGGHLGIDLWSSHGAPIIAAAPGVVTRALFDPAYGRRITIFHGTDDEGMSVLTQYFHMSEFTAKVGDRVDRGQEIGKLGASDALAGFVHLHFEGKPSA